MFEFEFIKDLIAIILINIILSGDNAVVIALASRHLPPKQQKQAIFWGSFGAIALRVVLTFVAVFLLQVPLLQFVGALLLVWIAYKLLNDNHDSGEEIEASGGLMKAIKTVIVADFIMSLDNVVAVAGIAGTNIPLIVIGLGISIPLIIWGSQLLMMLMNRFPIIIWAGAGLLAWTAGEMILKDQIMHRYVLHYLGAFEWIVPLSITVALLTVCRLKQLKKGPAEDSGGEADKAESLRKAEGN